jgi:6-phosphogluconolactonase
VRHHLLQSCASQAQWWPLYVDGVDLPAAAIEKGQQLRQALYWPADVVMLGMGSDGHTASWFQGDALPVLPTDDRWCMAVAAPAAPNVVQPRLSLTPRALLDACKVVVVVQGNDKEATLGRALLLPLSGGASMPIQLALWQTSQPCDVFFSP